jgi:hypothetical protein
MRAAGVEVRVGPDSEKLALSSSQAWVGSANATGGRPRTIDWGTRTSDAAIRRALGARFEGNWNRARAGSARRIA